MSYVCDACGGVSDVPKVCETKGCAKEGEPLTRVDDAASSADELDVEE